jgi:predicted TIM-barrel fold metal-dependent hydrolase
MTAIDSHYHLDESMVSLPGLVASMDAAGIGRMALIPILCPPLELSWVAGPLLPVFRSGIHGQGFAHRLALFMYRDSVKDNGEVDLLGRRYEVKVQPRNDDVIEALARHPDRFYGWACVNPAGPVDPVAEAERCLKVPGMIGVKAHPFWHDYPVSLLKDTAALCAEKGWPMLVHLGVRENGDFRLLPEAFPRLKIIYAHAGIPYSRDICAWARGRDNVFVDLSSSSYVGLAAARHALTSAGAEKLLFGSDGPYFHARDDRFDFRPFLDMVAALDLSAADNVRVMGRNFLDIIGAD